MKFLISFLFIWCLLFLTLSAQNRSEWFPPELNIQPYTANILEARNGFSYMLGESSIRLDIGTSRDLYHYQEKDKTFSLGADFFTYTRLHGSGEFHFPVETIDYFFGVNGGYKVTFADMDYGLRARIGHISAHLVDGSYDYVIDDWRNYQRPRVYSREFIELLPFFRLSGLRIYAGMTYLLHASPDIFGKIIYQGGLDFYLLNMVEIFTPFAAYDFKLSKIDEFSGTNMVSAGIKFGEYDKKGFSVLFSYIAGKSIHGEYYDKNESYSAIGFNLDL